MGSPKDWNNTMSFLKKWQSFTWFGVGLIAFAEVLTLSLWFSASVVYSPLQHLWHLNSFEVALLTSSVQLGFVLGAFLSSFIGIADRFNPRKIFVISAIVGAGANGLFVLSTFWQQGILLRILTGIAMVGVYPIAVKLIVQWSPKHRGLAIGVLIASLTLGSALPHLILFFGFSVSWQYVVLASSVLALVGAAIIGFVLPDRVNEASQIPSKISLNSFKKVLSNKEAMLANYGYFGHMWELYGMWTWFPVFIYSSYVASGHPTGALAKAAIVSFVVIGIAGATGAIVAGYLADKVGRTIIASVSMAISGICCLVIGLSYESSSWIVISLAIVWGVSIIADSAQFSAAVSELSEPKYLGTAITFQTAIGFFITIISINLIAVAKGPMGWQWVFTLLSIGPFIGVYAMLRLRSMDGSLKMANGRR